MILRRDCLELWGVGEKHRDISPEEPKKKAALYLYACALCLQEHEGQPGAGVWGGGERGGAGAGIAVLTAAVGVRLVPRARRPLLLRRAGPNAARRPRYGPARLASALTITSGSALMSAVRLLTC